MIIGPRNGLDHAQNCLFEFPLFFFFAITSYSFFLKISPGFTQFKVLNI